MKKELYLGLDVHKDCISNGDGPPRRVNYGRAQRGSARDWCDQ